MSLHDFEFLPWQREHAQQWLGDRKRYAHAWLIHGLPGIGKVRYALAAAASLLCETPVHGLACGHCQACGWVRAQSHPDLRRIRPDAIAVQEGDMDAPEATAGGAAKKLPSQDIRVEQLRSLTNWFNTATHRGGWRVAVIYPAGAMNAITANALLKVLEEPPAHTVFLLVADAPDRLLPTLVSRCRRVPLPIPPRDESLAWLEANGVAAASDWLAASGGAPLRAWEHAQNHAQPYAPWLPTVLDMLSAGHTESLGALADELDKLSTGAWIDSLQRLFVDLQLVEAGAQPRYYPGLAQGLARAAAAASADKIAETASWLAQQRRLSQHPLNTRLLAHAAMQRIARLA